MNLELLIRNRARQILPAGIRRPIGAFCGKVRSTFLYPLMGLTFDLMGGKYKVDGCSFVIPKRMTSLAFRASFLMNSYEEDERRLVKKYVQPEDSVLELGACLGIISCITNKRLRDASRHVVVEANPYCLPYLYQNREINRASFLVENCAVSNEREASFAIHPMYITGSRVATTGNLVRVPGRRLSELIARYGPFTVLIMDIEGGELEQLQSSREALPDFRLILIELHESVIGSDGVERCRCVLKQAGFKMVERSYITEAWLKD
jgi:FkbM family methyltransferase